MLSENGSTSLLPSTGKTSTQIRFFRKMKVKNESGAIEKSIFDI